MLPLFFIESCKSTNDEIIPLIERHQNTLAVCTFNQTQGRGQYGNSWVSPPNQNIAYSIAVEEYRFQISDILFNFHTATILRDFIANLSGMEVKIKWPNDIILKGKKISGMLTEKKIIGNRSYYILGIGLNVLQEDFGALHKAGSLFTQTKQKFDIKNTANELHQNISKNIYKTKNKNLILEEINAHLFRRNEVSVFQQNGIRQNGIIKYTDQNGFLWIETENDGLKRFFHKEIELLY